MTKIMTLSKIRSAYDALACMSAGENQALQFNILDTYWAEYDGDNLGEYRQVIEDRRELVASKIRQAGFSHLI